MMTAGSSSVVGASYRTTQLLAFIVAVIIMANPLYIPVAVAQSATVSAVRLEGVDRYATAAAVATASFPQAYRAVMARGDLFPDALVASYLAGFSTGGPLLLTPPDRLHPAAADALRKIQVQEVFIVGDREAIGDSVESDLRALGLRTVRFSGATRYATAEAVAASDADEVGALSPFGRTALLASGEQFPDALSAAPISYRARFPLLLTPRDTLAVEAQRSFVQRSIRHVVIIGGLDAVSRGVEDSVRAMAGTTVERIAGADRSETAAAVARFATDVLQWPAQHVGLVRGDIFPDAVAAGPHGGAERSPILLTPNPTSLGAGARAYLESRRGSLVSLHAFGNNSALSDAVVEEARLAGSPS